MAGSAIVQMVSSCPAWKYESCPVLNLRSVTPGRGTTIREALLWPAVPVEDRSVRTPAGDDVNSASALALPESRLRARTKPPLRRATRATRPRSRRLLLTWCSSPIASVVWNVASQTSTCVSKFRCFYGLSRVAALPLPMGASALELRPCRCLIRINVRVGRLPQSSVP